MVLHFRPRPDVVCAVCVVFGERSQSYDLVLEANSSPNLAGILVRFVYNAFEQRVAARLRENHVSSQLDAASGLLQLTCDAVMELDDDLRLREHSSKLAAMLLRSGSSTQGACS